MKNVQISFNNGKKKLFPVGTTYYEVSKHYESEYPVVGVMLDKKLASLHDKVDSDKKIEFIDINSTNGNRVYASGLKMVLEYSIKELFSGADVRYLYSLPRGMVVKIDYDKFLNSGDLANIRKMMAKVIKDDIVIEKLVVKNYDGVSFYGEDLNNQVKAENISNIVDHTVVLYRLDNLINYYYTEMPYSTGVITKYELHYLGRNTLVLIWPTENDKGQLPDYVNYKNVIDAYRHGEEWLETLKVPYITDINRKICTGKINSFVKSSELNFNLGINETAKYIAETGNIKCVMISGPSSSGKTTVTKRLASYFEIYGLDPIIISIDDYFHERKDNPKDENGENDYECLEATDMDYLVSDVIKLFNGEEINLPKFNFITGCKEVTGKKIKLKENSILLFEGLHAINEEVLPMIPDVIKYKIYVSPYIPLCLDQQNYISLNDLRLIRRIVRDNRTRGYSVEATIDYWHKVRRGEEKYIIPCINQADKIINTSLPYEVGVLKVFVEPLLYSVQPNSEYYTEARRLLSFLKQFFAISSENVPNDSIIREFIGGSIYD